jgi:hypothetical protein
LLVACGGPLKYQVPSSSKAPGADAKIIAEVKADQRQTMLDITAENLPPAARVSDGSSTFVVWQRKDSSGKWSRVGGLQYKEGDRKGTFKGSVPETSFDLEISAEKEAAAESPSADIVFAQRVN